ncbi:MAG: hypothetical protein HDR88_04865 [Bacteroides sp.]|nr:hypothetical protein [Bacteroides sp.]
MKKFIYLMLTLAAFSLGITGCSDNTDDNLIPEQRETTLIIKSITSASGETYTNDETLTLGAGAHKLTVEVESNTRWKVEIVMEEGGDGGWCSSNIISGLKDESFILTLRDNRNEKRKCNVNLYKVTIDNGEEVTDKTATRSITIEQDNSEVYLTPSSVEPFRASNPRTEQFQIEADNIDWTLSIYYPGTDLIEFITIIPDPDKEIDIVNSREFTGSGDSGFTIELLDNRTAADRSARLTLSSDVGNYTVEITQLASDYSFEVSPAETQVIRAEGDTIKFKIRSLSNWTAETVCDWLTITNKSGNASPTREENPVIVLPNLTGEERTGNIKFTPDNNDYRPVTISIVQKAYDSILYVSPTDTQYVEAVGDVVNYTITSLANWSVTTPAEWIKLPEDNEGVATQEPKNYPVTVMPNLTSGERRGEITFKPATAGYDDITVTIIQRPFDLSFYADKESLGILNSEAQTTDIKLDSRFDWEIRLPDWISSTITSGNASDREQTITLDIARNTSNNDRNGNITIVPLTTQFANDAPINPSNVGVSTINIPVTQFGGREPAISQPWLNDEYSQTSTVVNFTYYSPYYTITGVGLQWRKADASENDWLTEPVEILNDGTNDGTVSIKIEGLEAATDYLVQGFVVYNDGSREQRKYSPVSLPFKTPGTKPGENDNPTPGT